MHDKYHIIHVYTEISLYTVHAGTALYVTDLIQVLKILNNTDRFDKKSLL